MKTNENRFNKYFIDEDYFICKVDEINQTSKRILKFEVCEELNMLNNEVERLRSEESIQNQKALEVLQDLRLIFGNLKIGHKAATILGYIDKKIEMLSKANNVSSGTRININIS